MRSKFIRWPALTAMICGIHLYAYGAFSPMRAQAGFSLEELGVLAGTVLSTETKISEVREELVRVARTRAAPRVKKERQEALSGELKSLEGSLVQVRKQFSVQVKQAIFESDPTLGTSGSFVLPGKNGSFSCLSTDQGTTGTCTQENENITFRW